MGLVTDGAGQSPASDPRRDVHSIMLFHGLETWIGTGHLKIVYYMRF